MAYLDFQTKRGMGGGKRVETRRYSAWVWREVVRRARSWRGERWE